MPGKQVIPRGVLATLNQRKSPTPYPNLFEPWIIADRVYRDQKLNIDGYTFRNCAFINCQLNTSKANFTLQGCFLQSCTIYFTGNALKAVKLASLVSANWMAIPETLRATTDHAGSITIG